MLNKNDPLIAAVQKVMQSNQAEREAVKVVNEKFGVADRKALPRERQGEWDAAYKSVLTEGVDPSKYSKKQQDLAATAGNKKVIDGPDLDHVRKHGGKHIGEGSDPMGGDQTKPSEIAKGPDYAPAGTTPDYARPTTQTVNRGEKKSLPAGTIKEAVMNKIMKKLEEKKMKNGMPSKKK